MLILVVAVQEVLQVVGPEFLNLPGGDVYRLVPELLVSIFLKD
jgi:hypothetical protein